MERATTTQQSQGQRLTTSAKRRAETQRAATTQPAKANKHLKGDEHQPPVVEELLPGIQLEHGLHKSTSSVRRDAGDETRLVVEAVPTSKRVLVPAEKVTCCKVKASNHTCTISKHYCNWARDHERPARSRLPLSSPSRRPRSPCLRWPSGGGANASKWATSTPKNGAVTA